MQYPAKQKDYEMDLRAEEPTLYEKPTIVDYGDLRELTATSGTQVTDVPQGTPVGNPGGVVGDLS